MTRSFRPLPALAVAVVVLAAVAACEAPSPPAASSTASASATSSGPVTLYTLEEPEHRNPVPIVWHAESRVSSR